MKAFESALIEPQDDGSYNVTITPAAGGPTGEDPSEVDQNMAAAGPETITAGSLDEALSKIAEMGKQEEAEPQSENGTMSGKMNAGEMMNQYFNGGKGE